MKVIRLKKSTIKMVAFIFLFAFTVTALSKSFGMQNYYAVDFSTGLVTATTLNVRSGPGINYPIVASVDKNQYIRVFAGIGDWYVVQVDSNYIGVANKKYIKAIPAGSNGSTGSNTGSGTSSGSGNNSNTGSGGTTNNTSNLTSDELEVFNLINQQRSKNRISSTKNWFSTSKYS